MGLRARSINKGMSSMSQSGRILGSSDLTAVKVAFGIFHILKFGSQTPPFYLTRDLVKSLDNE